MITLRDYQKRAIDDLYAWFEKHPTGNPCIVMPTGSGKSVVIAELCRQAIQQWPGTRILMLTRSKELIEQNYRKLRDIWPNAPIGIYSASIGRKELGEPITIGGPLSVVKIADKIGRCDLLICDECHDISHNDVGSYRKIINTLLSVNPNMRVIGFTASPFRLGHGLITDKPAIFDDLIDPVSIEELVYRKYLAPLRSKVTDMKLNVDGVHKRGGEYIESELQSVVDTKDNNERMVKEIIKRAGDRKSWMIFCTGEQHAYHIRDLLIKHGITAVAITGNMPKREREQAIADIKSGKIRAACSINCLSTGFDHPDIDLIVLARPTMSVGVYLQQAGRGMRPKSHTDHCLVLDFAGNVSRHGPITAIRIDKKKPFKKGEGKAPVKTCESCGEIVYISTKICPACKSPFPINEKTDDYLVLHQDDIMGLEVYEMNVTGWLWRVYTSKTSGKKMLSVSYYSGITEKPIVEYLPLLHDGYAGDKAIKTLLHIIKESGATIDENCNIEGEKGLDVIVNRMNKIKHPNSIKYRRNGKFFKIISRCYN